MDFVSMLPSLFKGATGIGQFFAGLFGQPERPTYEIPSAAKEALNVSKNLAAQKTLPGQGILETQMGEKTANLTKSLERMGGGGAGMGALSNLYAQEAAAKRNLAVDAARYYAGNQGQLQNQLSNFARYQDKAWQKNVGDKYDEESGASSALMQAGLTNVSTGLGDIAGANSYAKLFKNMNTTGMGNANLGTAPLAKSSIKTNAFAENSGPITPEELSKTSGLGAGGLDRMGEGALGANPFVGGGNNFPSWLKQFIMPSYSNQSPYWGSTFQSGFKR